jgi:hypothetical protein
MTSSPVGGGAPSAATRPEPADRGLLRRLVSADFLIAAFLLVLFIAAYLATREWPQDAKLFPIMVSTAGMALAALKMVLALLPRRSAAVPPGRHRTVGDVELTDDEDEADHELEYIFERASRRDWIRVLLWASAFFVALLLVGAIASILVFTFLYLLREASASVLVAGVYAAVLSGLLYAANTVINISLPPGILFN